MFVDMAHLTRDEAQAHAANAVAVVPVGSTEQHGPHLPMLTDTLLVDAVLDRALSRLSETPTMYVRTPSIPVGCSDHHLFAAAVSLRIDTLRSVLTDVCDSLVASGFRQLVLVNGHGGNDECVSLAAKELVLRHRVAAAACSYWSLGATSDRARAGPGHAGWFETSMMLAAHPSLVKDDLLTRHDPMPPPIFNQSEVPGLVAQRAGEWERVDGVTDAASEATAADGERLLDDFGSRLAAVLEWFAANTVNDQRTATNEEEAS